MNGQNSVCKHQADYTAYVSEHDIYNADNWNINVRKLAKYIKENGLKTEDITEEIINQFIVE